jgi:hypothetical protein
MSSGNGNIITLPTTTVLVIAEDVNCKLSIANDLPILKTPLSIIVMV